jgi:hypothetical protein
VAVVLHVSSDAPDGLALDAHWAFWRAHDQSELCEKSKVASSDGRMVVYSEARAKRVHYVFRRPPVTQGQVRSPFPQGR